MTRLLTLVLVVGMAGCAPEPLPTPTSLDVIQKVGYSLYDYETMKDRNVWCEQSAIDSQWYCIDDDSIHLDQPTGLTHDDPLPDLKEITNE